MILDDLKNVIRESCKNDCFDYTEESLKKILKGTDGWAESWIKVFKLNLKRIKQGRGAQDGTNNEGKVVALPLPDKKNCMMVFFTLTSKKRFMIYDFKIDKIK